MPLTPDHSSEDESLDIEFASMDDSLGDGTDDRDLSADDAPDVEFSAALTDDESCDGIEFSSAPLDELSGDVTDDVNAEADSETDAEFDGDSGFEATDDNPHVDDCGSSSGSQSELSDEASGFSNASRVQPASPVVVAAIDTGFDEEPPCATRGSNARQAPP